ncbi:MAG: hypothetical protein CMQ55_03580 [Gammaproteobacteria bacterium]|nr:hypothetical protein [Gammaproteobacteria bacterium]
MIHQEQEQLMRSSHDAKLSKIVAILNPQIAGNVDGGCSKNHHKTNPKRSDKFCEGKVKRKPKMQINKSQNKNQSKLLSQFKLSLLTKNQHRPRPETERNQSLDPMVIQFKDQPQNSD